MFDGFVELFSVILQEVGELKQLMLAVLDRLGFAGPVAGAEGGVRLDTTPTIIDSAWVKGEWYLPG